MSVVPTAHGTSHGSGGNDPIVFSDVTLGATGVVTFTERTDPAAPAADKAILYAKDNGSGKTLLVVRFNTGAIQTIATQP